MSIWLRYLAIAVLIGNAFTSLWNLMVLARSMTWASSGLVGFNLSVSVAAIVLAVLVAAPAREIIGLGAKLIAIPAAVGGGVGIASSALWFRTWAERQHLRSPTDINDAVAASFTLERLVQNTVFSACTLLLAILVLLPRRTLSESRRDSTICRPPVA